MRIADLLIGLGLSTRDSIHLFREGTRDRADIRVFRCDRSHVIFLETDDHVTSSYYSQMSAFDYWGQGTRADATRATARDDTRRAGLIQPLIQNRRWLDIGTGTGGLLDLAGGGCARVVAVEPQPVARTALQAAGYDVHADVCEIRGQSFDLITLFHVFEHLPHPIDFLRSLKRLLASGGRICIEVPHARDLLIEFLMNEPFIKFTLWSEHLILHSRASLQRFVEESGLRCRDVAGIQRYPLANHLHWLAKGKPGGHDIWAQLSDPDIDRAYATMLARLDHTDTLLAWIEA